MTIALADLTALLGKEVDNPSVKQLLSRAGKVTIKPDYVIAKDAGFDFALARPPGAKKKQLHTLFLYAEGRDRHRQFSGLPAPFAFGVPRAQLLAAAGAPAHSWTMGKGKVKVDAKAVDRDTWTIAGAALAAEYDEGVVSSFFATRPEGETGGRELATHPLHFETQPVDAPDEAGLTGMALLVAWAAEAHGLPPKHAGHAVARRGVSPRTFLVEACDKTLTTLDFAPELGEFLWNYVHHVLEPEDERAKTDRPIAKLLRLESADRLTFADDFLGTFADLESAFYVPDSWAAVDRLAPVLAARLADFRATGFLTAPDLKVYEQAAKQRDAVTLAPVKKTLTPVAVDAGLADELVGLLGRSLKDKAVRAVLERAGLPIGKRIDQQANPALGVSYLGTKVPLTGKPELGVATVWFYAQGYRTYVRGIGAEVEFRAWPSALPLGLELGMRRAEVAAVLGKPTRTSGPQDFWAPKGRAIQAEFSRGTLVMLQLGLPPGP